MADTNSTERTRTHVSPVDDDTPDSLPVECTSDNIGRLERQCEVCMDSLLRIPRHFRNLNTFAREAGFAVGEVYVGTFRENAHHGSWLDNQVLCDWRGTEDQLRALHIVPNSFRVPEVSSTIKAGWLRTMGHGFFPVWGRVNREPDGLSLTMCGGPVPDRIEEVGGLQICEWEDRILVHGSARDLSGFSEVENFRLPAGCRSVTGFRARTGSPSPEWDCRRCRDGMYVLAAEKRCAAVDRAARDLRMMQRITGTSSEMLRSHIALRLVSSTDNVANNHGVRDALISEYMDAGVSRGVAVAAWLEQKRNVRPTNLSLVR